MFCQDNGAAAVSDETFLEQTKLKAQEALENALLMTTRLQRLRSLGCTGQAEGSENFEISGNNRQADSVDAILEQAKLKTEIEHMIQDVSFQRGCSPYNT